MAVELKTDGELTTVKDAELIPGGDKTASYQIRHITPKKFKDVAAAHTTTVANRRTHQMEKITDWDAVTEELFSYALFGWDGITRNGEPAACSADNWALLDGQRRDAIMQIAGLNEVKAAAEAKVHSFRPLADVR